MLVALRIEIDQLKADIVRLTGINEQLRKEIEVLKGDGARPSAFVKANTHREKRQPAPKPRRKRAAEQNGVRKKAPPTEIQQHAVEYCPDCHYKLRGHSIARRREVIDLPVMPAVQVVEHQVIKRWCPKCKIG